MDQQKFQVFYPAQEDSGDPDCLHNLRISAGLSGLVLNQGISDTFSIKASGVVGEFNPTIKNIDVVVRKASGNKSKTEIISWKER